MLDCLIVGGGPAGLMAADIISRAQRSCVVIDQMPSLARKFLMAGKSGLNLTRDEDLERFLQRYPDGPKNLINAVRDFPPSAVIDFAENLGQECFRGSTGRVFPKVMKASPLLRAWLARLSDQGVEFRTRTRWQDCHKTQHRLCSPEGDITIKAKTLILATGGASWQKLGSDGAWAERLSKHGLPIEPFAPSNMGITLPWSSYMEPYFGQPLKDVAFYIGDIPLEGEAVISATGLEGTAIYQASAPLRNAHALSVDLRPTLSKAALKDRLAKLPAKSSQSNLLRKAIGLDATKQALLNELARPLPKGSALVDLIKRCPLPYRGLAPMDRAISTAGGLSFASLDAHFMITAKPGWFAAGEMLNWDAPTGGYLLTACFATGAQAGRGVLNWLR